FALWSRWLFIGEGSRYRDGVPARGRVCEYCQPSLKEAPDGRVVSSPWTPGDERQARRGPRHDGHGEHRALTPDSRQPARKDATGWCPRTAAPGRINSGLQPLDAVTDHSNPVVHPVFPPLPELHHGGCDEVTTPGRGHRH